MRFISFMPRLVLFLLLVAPTWASTLIFSTFGTVDPFTTDFSYSLQNGSDGSSQVAVGFGISFPYTLHSFVVAGQHTDGVNDYRLSILSDNNGNPNAVLTTYSFQLPLQAGQVTIPATDNFLLQPGVYWAALSAFGSPTAGGWFPGLTQPFTFAIRNAATDDDWAIEENRPPALQIYVNDPSGPSDPAIPEPSTWVLISGSLLALSLLRRPRP